MSERCQTEAGHCPGKCRTEADFGIRYRDMEAGLPVYAPSVGDGQQKAYTGGCVCLSQQKSLYPEFRLGYKSWRWSDAGFLRTVGKPSGMTAPRATGAGPLGASPLLDIDRLLLPRLITIMLLPTRMFRIMASLTPVQLKDCAEEEES